MANEIMPANLDGRALDRWARDSLVKLATGPKGGADGRARLNREIDGFASELAGPAPSAAERTLAESAALDWAFLRFAEANLAYGLGAEKPFTMAQSDHAQRKCDRAHRRLLRTLKTLATVRRLALPALQVNIGAQQLNVAGLAPPTREGGAEILDAAGPHRTGSGPHELTGGNGLSSA